MLWPMLCVWLAFNLGFVAGAMWRARGKHFLRCRTEDGAGDIPPDCHREPGSVFSPSSHSHKIPR